jgi:hypothetical protein
VDHCLPYFRQWLFTCPLSALLLFQPLFTEISHRDQLLVPPPSVSVLSATLSLCCVLVFSSLFIVQFFLWGCGVSLPRVLCWFILEVAMGILCEAWCSPVGLPNVPQTGLELASGSMAALFFSQCNVAWRSFPSARGSGYLSFFFFNFYFIHMCIQCLGHFSSLPPTPSLTPPCSLP